MAAPYAASSRRSTPKRTSCSKSPRAGVLALNHIVGDISTASAWMSAGGLRVRAEISTIDISDLTHYPSFRGPSDQPAWAAVARVFMGLSAEQTAVRQASAILLEFCLERRQSRNSNIMRPLSFDPNVLRQHLRRHTIATLDELKRALGTPVDVTVFRKLQTLDYLSSYSHRGAYYTLRPLARFSPEGLWSHEGVWFSRSGTLVATAEAFVTQSSSGYFADELARALHVEVHDALRALTTQGRLRRTDVSGVYLYTAAESTTHRRQVQARRTAHAVPIAVAASALQIAPDELGAAILLFYSLLDEQQRRLYARLGALTLGHCRGAHPGPFLRLHPPPRAPRPA